MYNKEWFRSYLGEVVETQKMVQLLRFVDSIIFIVN